MVGFALPQGSRRHAWPHALMVKPPRAFLLPASKRERGGARAPCRGPRCPVRRATIVSYSNKLLPFVANTTAFEHRVDGRLAVSTSVRRRASTRTLVFSSPAHREQSRVVDGVDRPIAPAPRGG